LAEINRKEGVVYSALTPNLKGYEGAFAAKADTVAVFASASESFSQKNINCSVAESLGRFDILMQKAKADNVPVRGYVSCIIGCPYEGDVDPQAVLDVSQALLDMGCYEVSLGDTIGVATPLKMQKLLNLLISRLPVSQLALHCHDTYGQALANVLLALQNGIATYDASVAGLGGCPYAKGASGNLATEDLTYMLQNMDIKTGVDIERLRQCGQSISQVLKRNNQSKVGIALSAKK
jgi:hydroxymethylglutaryl-CoA lyase